MNIFLYRILLLTYIHNMVNDDTKNMENKLDIYLQWNNYLTKRMSYILNTY